MALEPDVGGIRWSGSGDRTASVWVGAAGAGKSADGGGGDCVCAGEGERVVCEWAVAGKEVGEVTGSSQVGCCGPPVTTVKG